MNNDYLLLPFNFKRSNKGYLLSNDVGDYIDLSNKQFDDFINRRIDVGSKLNSDLYGRFITSKKDLPSVVDVLATRYRTKKAFLFEFTTLHMIVLTKKCNQHCRYCHASSSEAGQNMSTDTIEKCIDTVLNMPAQAIKIEFQGGEPTLNFEGLKHAVLYTKGKNSQKQIEFVVCTNLYHVEQEQIEFYKSNNIQLSVSLDGPQMVHDKNRINHACEGTYSTVVDNLMYVQSQIGKENISALMTVTNANINHLREVVDEYLLHGLNSIFIRSLNPFGYACENWDAIGYSTDDFISAYKDVLEYIITINKKGTYFPELFASILLSRILTPFSTGFVDLQSPAGVGIQGVIYNVDGDVIVSDEARMYQNMTGSRRFSIGNILECDWKEMFRSEKLKEIISKSIIETLPMCETCFYQPYCGADPIKNYALEKDLIGFKPSNDFCRKQKAVFDIIFKYILIEDEEINQILLSWVTGRTPINVAI